MQLNESNPLFQNLKAIEFTGMYVEKELKDIVRKEFGCKVLDLYGKESIINQISIMNNLIEMDLTGINSGIYFIYLKSSASTKVLRFIKH